MQRAVGTHPPPQPNHTNMHMHKRTPGVTLTATVAVAVVVPSLIVYVKESAPSGPYRKLIGGEHMGSVSPHGKEAPSKRPH